MNLKQNKRTKIHVELLKNDNVSKEYKNEVIKNLKENNVHLDIDEY